MKFRLVRTGRNYRECSGSSAVEPGATTAFSIASEATLRVTPDETECPTTPLIIWKGTADEYRSLLVQREADLVVVRAQLTGNDRVDWYAKNRIIGLETMIADLRKWLAQAIGNVRETG